MIERYSLPRMREIWSEENKISNWLRVELLACEAMVKLGIVPEDAYNRIKERAKFDIERIQEIEKRTRHDVVAFLENLAENIGEDSRYIHLGMTSSDVLDTALAVQLKESCELLIEDMSRLFECLKNKALEHKETLMIGRTHGVHAEPITLGVKFAVWAFEIRRNMLRMESAKKAVSCGKLSGAVGTYANLDPFVEEYVCAELGLSREDASTQVVQRDRHAEYMCALAITASSLEKFATEIRALQRTEVREAEEPFKSGQTGSSAMPHKRNPILCERICGLARVVRGNALAALENIPLWHERDISHSSVERVILPDSSILLDYMLNKFIGIMEGLAVFPDRMRANIDISGGLIFSEKVMLSLIGKGLTRQEAYRIVQRNAMRAFQGEGSFKESLLSDAEFLNLLGKDEINGCFDIEAFVSRKDEIFRRLESL